jgi:CspA family cold shock protein
MLNLRLLETEMADSCMEKGKVKWFSEQRGFGIIESDNNEEVFVHFSEIQSNDVKSLRENQEVEFEIIKGEESLLAINVSLK